MARPVAKITDMAILLAAVMVALAVRGPPPVTATTNSADVEALHVLYNSLNSPQQLSGWKSKGGDPCGESWMGISCSGSAVISIQIPGLQLRGTLGYLLSNFSSLTILDVSNNYIHDVIPYQLPPNLTYMNFGGNNLSGNLPFSISAMTSLSYLNASHNSLSQSVGDFFGHLEELSILDLSFNNFSGALPNSLGSLSKLSSLCLQNNWLSGQVKVLSNLTLNKLNIANNNFSGRIPASLSSIPDLRFEGNSFDGIQAPAPAPAPTPVLAPNHAKSSNNSRKEPPSRGFNGTTTNTSGKRYHGSSIVGQIVGIVLGSLFVSLSAAFIVILCLRNHAHGKHAVKKTSKSSTSSLVLGKDRGDWNQMSDYMSSHAPTEWSYRMKDTLSSNSQSSSPHQNKATNEAQEIRAGVSVGSPSLESPEGRAPYRDRERSALWKKKKVPVNVTFYTVATLQSLTNSFSQECLIGEGSHGRVYRADLSNGKVLAIKKLESSGRAAAACEEEKFIEAVCNMSRLRQSSIVPLVGYCVEHGQRLLVHEFIGNGNLHDILHRIADEESGKPFSWNARMKVALGAARALEYLHEVCLPAVVHKNVKSANILLDEDLNPYLSDCGLASLIPSTPLQDISAQVMDSFGYSAPESAMAGVYTVKSDVYSFGVIMLELLTGRKSHDGSKTRGEQSLVRWAAPQLHDIDSLARMVDPALNGVYPARSLSRFADVIALCVQAEPEFRPAMSEVVQSLIRLVQRSSLTKRHSGEEFGFTYKTPERDAPSDPPTY